MAHVPAQVLLAAERTEGCGGIYSRPPIGVVVSTDDSADRPEPVSWLTLTSAGGGGGGLRGSVGLAGHSKQLI